MKTLNEILDYLIRTNAPAYKIEQCKRDIEKMDQYRKTYGKGQR